jgi:uncharacterized cupin superfamily protein
MITLLSPAFATPPRVIDPRYVGDSDSRFERLIASIDGCVETGVWRFRGSHTTPVHTGYDEVLVILEGELEIQSADGDLVVRAGEVVFYEPPIAPQRLSSPDGILAAYVIRHHVGATGGPVSSSSEG